MARIYGYQISTLTLGGQTLLADTISLDVPLDAETGDATTMGNTWKESSVGLLGGGSVKHELFYDNANTTGSYAYLVAKLIAKTPVALVWSDGTRTMTGDVVVTNVTPPFNVGDTDQVKITATYKQTGAITPA